VPIDATDLPPMSRVEQLTDKLGIEVVSMSLDEVVGTMPVAGNRQPFGLLHGGASAVLAEALGSTLSALHALPDLPGRAGAGLHPSPVGDPRAGDRGGAAAARRAEHVDHRDRRLRRAGPAGLLGQAHLPAPRHPSERLVRPPGRVRRQPATPSPR
jgi:hypothetical protein